MKTSNTDHLQSEKTNPATADLDQLSALEIVSRMNEADQDVPRKVGAKLDVIAFAVERIAASLERGGRLFYVGAGTSGRLGALDAYECPPTFGTNPETVQALIAGGPRAASEANEEAEDDAEQGALDLQSRFLTPIDAVVGIAASGRTPYVLGALQYARQIGAASIALSCNESSEIGRQADIAIEIPVGPEILTGSTRLKAGTAQKLVLNMISTAVMVRLGKAYGNLMVDMQPTNGKLRDRAVRIVAGATGADADTVRQVLTSVGYEMKTAIVMLKSGRNEQEARELLDKSKGRVREALLLSE